MNEYGISLVAIRFVASTLYVACLQLTGRALRQLAFGSITNMFADITIFWKGVDARVPI